MFVLPIHCVVPLLCLFVVVVVQTTLCVVLFVNYSEISIIFYCISIFNIIIVFIIMFVMVFIIFFCFYDSNEKNIKFWTILKQFYNQLSFSQSD